MVKNIFKVICEKCQGKCCKSTIFLTQTDVDKLNQKHRGLFQVRDEKTGLEKTPGIMVHNQNGNCPFLDESKGCTLTEAEKPFDCQVFPVAFINQHGKTTFYLNKKCPYYQEIPKEWVKSTIKWATKELKSWTKEEKKEYSRMIEKYPPSQLIPLSVAST